MSDEEFTRTPETPESSTASAPNTESDSSSKASVRSVRRAQREAEKAARAQAKADAARQRAIEAARAGGLFEGMEAAPRVEAEDRAGDRTTDPGATSSATGAATADERGTGPATAGTSTAPPPRTDAGGGERAWFFRIPPAALAVATVVMLLLAGLAGWQYVEEREAAATEQAISNAPGEATDAARDITTRMFTYDHPTVDDELAAVRDSLVDPALKEFVETSMPAVSSSAKEQEATVFATVASAAPEEVVDADHVTVLVMLNRMVSTKENPKAVSSASRLRVQMVNTDDGWKLSKLDAL